MPRRLHSVASDPHDGPVPRTTERPPEGGVGVGSSGMCAWAGPVSRPDSHEERPRGRGSFGCFVNLPLGSRSADPHSTAVWCGNLLHSSPQPHIAGIFRSSPDGVLATTTKICARRHSSRGWPRPALQSLMPFLHNDALLRLPQRWWIVRELH